MVEDYLSNIRRGGSPRPGSGATLLSACAADAAWMQRHEELPLTRNAEDRRRFGDRSGLEHDGLPQTLEDSIVDTVCSSCE
jgi:hypothetical protein